MRREKAIIIGGGMAGLACAIDLARNGLDVVVAERAASAGGKLREVDLGSCRVDAGPTVFTMPWVFEALFRDAGASLDRAITLRPLDVLARHSWGDGAPLDLFADIERSCDAIGRFAGPREAAGYLAFCKEARAIYGTLRHSFLTAQKTGPLGLTRRVGRMGDLLGIRPFDTFWTALEDRFDDPRLRQLFGRYATYCGSSPFAAPATLMLIAHVEQSGVWSIDGGMARLAEALAQLAASLGVVFRYGAHVEEILFRRGRACGVRLQSGETLSGDYVVSNADVAALGAGRFGAPTAPAIGKISRQGRSLSAVTWALRAQTRGFPLLRHNVFFSADYRSEFDDIFKRARLPAAPTVYVCAQDREAGDMPRTYDRLLLLVNAPANGDRGLDEEELTVCETRVFEHLRRCGLEVDLSAAESIRTTPQDFDAMFPATGGALYGRAMHGWSAAFRRPGAKTRRPGLYLAGGGAHPGAGVPMAALSGRLAAQRLLMDRASTSTFRAAAIAGGMSTPSATMVGTASP
ncbi:MAG: 1-hydroxycarotenoid 3,4-desaturase CrtD [Caulobacteraceae bacterium]